MHDLPKKMLIIKIQFGDYWQAFIRCAWVTLNKWSIIGGLRWLIKMIEIEIYTMLKTKNDKYH